MELHSIKRPVKRKARKRVGRGNGNNWGRTAGRGEKGQMSRSGARHRPYFEGGQIPLFRRIPKRGFKSRSHKDYTVINLSVIQEADVIADGAELSVSVLQEMGLVNKKLGSGLKVLGDGELKKKVSITADKFSKTAIEKIEAAGGSYTCTQETAKADEPAQNDQ